MDQKFNIQMNIKEGDHEFIFLMPYGSPIGSAYNAAHKVLVDLAEMARNAAEKAKPIDSPVDPDLQ